MKKTYVPDIESYPPSAHQIESIIIPGVSPHFKDKASFKRFHVKKVGEDIPESFDWRDYDAVTDVKFEGLCNTDREFVVVGAAEALLKFRTKAEKATDLSPQHLHECAPYPYKQRDIQNQCHRRQHVFWLFNFIIDYGMVLEQDYPYTSANGQSGVCDANKSSGKINLQINEFWYVAGDEDSMKVALYRYGPLMGMMYVDWWFEHYKNGVFWMSTCEGYLRAVLIIGYGIDPDLGEYWIVKMNWGTKWGEFGYIRVARNIKTCSIHELAFFVV